MIAPIRRPRQMAAGDAETLQAPRYSAEAEKAVLGSMLARPDMVVDEIGDQLSRDDFFVPAHQELYEAITTLHNGGKAIDITTLHQFLTDRKLAEVVGSPGILAELAAGLATHLNVGSYVAIVKEKSLVRHLQHACADTATEIQDEADTPAAELVNRAEARFFALSSTGARAGEVVSMRDAVPRAVTRIEQFANRTSYLTGIPSGLDRLDRLTTGWQNGEMIVFAARPGIGKTALGLQCAKHAADKRWHDVVQNFVSPGHPTGMFSLEMPEQQLMPRLVASRSSVPMQAIRSGRVSEAELNKIRLMADDYSTLPLYFDFSSFLTLPMLSSRLRRMKRNYGIELAVIDYLQLLRLDGKSRPEYRQQEVAEISRGIKGLAKELDIPIIVLAQLNRKSEDAGKKPGLHNLRESGAIEQDADTIILLHKDDEGTYTLLLEKQRNGPTDEFPLIFHSSTQTFEALEETPKP